MVNAAVSGAPCSLYNELQKIENNILAFKELFTFYTVEDIQGVNNFFCLKVDTTGVKHLQQSGYPEGKHLLGYPGNEDVFKRAYLGLLYCN